MKERTSVDLRKFNAFLRKNQRIDFKETDLQNQTVVEGFEWNCTEEEKKNMLVHVKGYQRLLRVLPEDEKGLDVDKIAKEFLKMQIHSAVQIADMGKKEFLKKIKNLFKEKETLAEQIFQRALAIRKVLVLKYLNHMQQLEPHTKATGIHL